MKEADTLSVVVNKATRRKLEREEKAERQAKKRKATAYHEAGHTVIAQGLGFWLGPVSINRAVVDVGSGPKPSRGHTFHASRVPHVQCLVELALMGLGGFAAERRFDPAAEPRVSSHTDFNDVAEELGYRQIDEFDNARDAYFRKLLWQLDSMLAERWLLVEDLVAALLEKGSLSAHEVGQIIGAGLVRLGLAPDGFRLLAHKLGATVAVIGPSNEPNSGSLLALQCIVDYVKPGPDDPPAFRALAESLPLRSGPDGGSENP